MIYFRPPVTRFEPVTLCAKAVWTGTGRHAATHATPQTLKGGDTSHPNSSGDETQRASASIKRLSQSAVRKRRNNQAQRRAVGGEWWPCGERAGGRPWLGGFASYAAEASRGAAARSVYRSRAAAPAAPRPGTKGHGSSQASGPTNLQSSTEPFPASLANYNNRSPLPMSVLLFSRIFLRRSSDAKWGRVCAAWRSGGWGEVRSLFRFLCHCQSVLNDCEMALVRR